MKKTSTGKIIIIDDDIESMTGMRDFLLELGYEVEGYLSGSQALDAIREHKCSLLMTDLMMPVMDGITLMKKAKEIDPLIICIIITGHASIETAVEAMKEGAFDYMTKPLDWKIVRMAISRALEVGRLMQSEEQLRTSRDQWRAFARRSAEIQERERQRISRELHDEIGQNLIALRMNLNSLCNLLTDKHSGQIDQRLTDSIGIVSDMTETIRDIIYNVRPAILDDFGLLAAIKSLSGKLSQYNKLRISVQGDEDMPRLPELAEISLYRIVQEALTNIIKHAQAENVLINLNQSDRSILLTITDDGAGFDTTLARDEMKTGKWGLINMRDRAESVGGTLRVESEKGKGARVTVEVKR